MSNETTTAAAEVVGAAIGSKVTYAGAGVSAASWWLSSEGGVLVGIALGVIGLIVNVHFKLRRDKREYAEHVARMAAIKGGCDVE